MSDEDDEYGDDFDSTAVKSPSRPPKASPSGHDTEQTELDELQAENDRLAADMQQLKNDRTALESQQKERDNEWSKKVESLKTQLKQAKDNDLVTKERDKLRVKIRHLSEDHKAALEAAAAGAGNYEESKRLVDVSSELLAAKQHVDNLKRAHADLLADCAEARSSLLSELLDELSSGNNGSSGNGEATAHLESVSGNRDNLLKMAAEQPQQPSSRSQTNGARGEGNEIESAVALKARRALDTGNNSNGDNGGGKKRALDPNNYQFVKIAELVRLRLDKKERECQRVVAEIKASVAKENNNSNNSGGGAAMVAGGGGNTRMIPTGGAVGGPGLLSATKARGTGPPLAGGGENGDGVDGGMSSTMDGAAMVARLEGELETMAQKNTKLEQKVQLLEGELKAASSQGDDLVVLKAKALQLLERQKGEKELRMQAESATKLANRKVLALSQHVEKLMLHLKHEAAAKAKAHDACGRAAQEVSLLKARNAALLRRASARDVVIVELKEGAKILEDQLRLMDEKYMELRTKLDFTRQSTGKDVIKYKAQASTLRAKWAMLSATVNSSQAPQLLDEVDVQSFALSMPANQQLQGGGVASVGNATVSFADSLKSEGGPENTTSSSSGRSSKKPSRRPSAV